MEGAEVLEKDRSANPLETEEKVRGGETFRSRRLKTELDLRIGRESNL
jgi:hypothetical protein